MSDQPPPGLKQYGWLTKDAYLRFKEAGIRAWTNPSYLNVPSKHPLLVWVEPQVITLSELYHKEHSKGNKWAGLSEVEFILSAASKDDNED
jgi:hypothetical protein